MRVFVDDRISNAASLFAPFGSVTLFPGRQLTSADLRQADALIVRSITRVDRTLLDGTPIRFVGTATTGINHIDVDYLRSANITFFDAAGSNSRTVAEYVLTTILHFAAEHQFDPADNTLGIVGLGRIGSLVSKWAQALGMKILACDPPLARKGLPGLVDFAHIARADIITFHVPLIDSGPDRTRDVLDEKWLSTLQNKAILINTSRGEITCDDALLAAIRARRLGPVAIDVWRDEPCINRDLADSIALATSHVAGYSMESKRNAAMQMRSTLARAANIELPEPIVDPLPPAGQINASQSPSPIARVAHILETACPLAQMNEMLREGLNSGAIASKFESIRATLSARREFESWRVSANSLTEFEQHFLRTVGFAS